jgi:hypothetical protein
MGSRIAAFQHLWAAEQLFRRIESHSLLPDLIKLAPLREVIIRLDLFAQSIVPCARSSFVHIHSLTHLKIWPSVSYPPGTASTSIGLERCRLEELISEYSYIAKVIWGPWYEASDRPSLDALHILKARLLQWKTESVSTLASCVESYTGGMSMLPGTLSIPWAELPLPPTPQNFTSAEAALSMTIFNCCMACTLFMMSTSNGSEAENHEEAAFRYVYQNFRIIEGLWPECGIQGRVDTGEYRPTDTVDVSITHLLYLGVRGCFSTSWQRWTIAKMRSIGREGLFDGHAFANTIDIMCQLQVQEEQSTKSSSPLGHLRDRFIPMLTPPEDAYIAYYMKFQMNKNAKDDSSLQVVARAKWEQDEDGSIENLNLTFYPLSFRDHGNSLQAAPQDMLTKVFPWRESVERGWYSILDTSGVLSV